MARPTAERFTIREATAADARPIARVHVEGWRWGYRGLLPDETLATLDVDERERWWTGILGGDAGRSTRFVATDDGGRVIGFVSCGPASSDEDVPPPEGAGEVYAIYLLDGVQGTGVGRGLLARAMHALRGNGFEHAVLWVLEANDRSRRFYEAAGWAWDGTRSDHLFDRDTRPIVRYSVSL